MNVVSKPRGLSQNNLNNESFMDNRIGFWGTVKDVHPETNRVDVLMDIGILLPGVPVGMNDYVKENKIGNNTFYSGKVDLPARESYVFCLMPNHSLTSAFVLCSGIPYGNDFKKKFFAESEEDKSDFPKVEKKTDQEGWTVTKRKDNGNLVISNVDETIKFSLCRENDQKDSNIKKGVTAECYGTKIFIDENGKISFSLNDNTEINLKTNKEITIKGDAKIKCENNVTVQGTSVTVKGNSGTLKVI